MTEQEMIHVARENIEAFNDGDMKRFKATLAPDSAYDEMGSHRHVRGAEWIVEAARDWKEAFPDAKGTITKAVAGDGAATVEVIWEGTHTRPLVGPGGTIPASGKHQVTRSVQVLSFEGGRIKESHRYFDMMTLVQQVGVGLS